MSGSLSFREKLHFRLRGVEHRNLPPVFRRALIKSLPDPFEGRSARLPDGREIIFLHVPKTGGTSLARSFGLQHGHVPATRFQTRDPDRFAQAFKFAFVRDPVDRVYSSFNYLRTAIGLNKSRDVRWSETYLARYQDFGSFVEALRDRKVRRPIMEWSHFRPMHCWLCSPGEKSPMIDFIGRFESLLEDTQTLGKTLGLSLDLPHARKAQDYLKKNVTQDMVKEIRELYRADVEIFGY